MKLYVISQSPGVWFLGCRCSVHATNMNHFTTAELKDMHFFGCIWSHQLKWTHCCSTVSTKISNEAQFKSGNVLLTKLVNLAGRGFFRATMQDTGRPQTAWALTLEENLLHVVDQHPRINVRAGAGRNFTSLLSSEISFITAITYDVLTTCNFPALLRSTT